MPIRSRYIKIVNRRLTWNVQITALMTFLLSILACPNVSNARVAPGSKADSAKECAICHYRWVYAFFVEHRDGELAPFPEESPVTLEERCFSCHDGGVMDDREKVFSDRGHKTGIKPSENVNIPEGFPLDEEGRIQCYTCHLHHEFPTDSGMVETWLFTRFSNEDSAMCTMCHIDKVGGPEKGNHSMQASLLSIPKELTDHGGRVGTDNHVICESCHIAHGGMGNDDLILPTEDPVSRSVLCEVCHGKHPSLKKDNRLKAYSHSVDILPDTASIPKFWSNGTPVVKGTRGEVVCRTCHAPHNAVDQDALLVEVNEKDSLCLECHKTQNSIEGTKHDLKRMAPKEKNILKQKAKDTGPCRTCHLTHQGTGPFMWARPWEGQDDPMLGICQSCHAEDECGEEAPIPKSSHTMGTAAKTFREPLALPLYASNGMRDTQGAIYCSSCHNTHRWDPVDPDNRGYKDDQADMTNSFLRVSNDQSALCMICHTETSSMERTDHDLQVTAPDEKNMLGQRPDESGLCGTCHLAHGGADAFMWARTLQEGNKPIMTQLCLECHSDGRCGEKKQIGNHFHPIEVRVKNPSGILPLFSTDGKQGQQGMIVCSTCHDPHRWNPDDPEKKGEDGTPSDSFLRIACSKNSPLCSKCHQNQRYIEGTDHDLQVTAPNRKNKQDLIPVESGLCGQCHAVHNAPYQPFIWGRDLGPSAIANWKEEFTSPNNVMIGVCTSCHLEGECAQAKIPDYGLHPNKIYMTILQEKSDSEKQEYPETFIDRFPLYTDAGKKSIEGNIVCTTCHDSHRWDTHRLEKGPGEEKEGNPNNSFLRKGIASTFCASCHGEESIYQYLNYHLFKARKK